MLIGICDDNELDIIKIELICKKFMFENDLIYQCVTFGNGQEVLNYCENPENNKIDLLFIDIEMPKMNGLELKEKIIKNYLVYRIAFITNHKESVYNSFSLKTIGFINKPVSYEEIGKMIFIVLDEIKENIIINCIGYNREIIKIPIENILYFEADGSYTKIYTYDQNKNSEDYKLISKKLGQIEKELKEYGFIRVHKSYLVNLLNITEVSETIMIRNIEYFIPIGRKYKEKVKNDYLIYGKEKIQKRL